MEVIYQAVTNKTISIYNNIKIYYYYKYMSEKKVPNSLIIFINTKIPNYYKINYDPSMSIPKSKSRTVYFDPLVKYNYSAVNNIPRGAPPETLVSQFFEATQFDSMINRILSSFFTMQRTKTLEQATNENIINNNIEITLNTLFKENNILYLNDVPYTIVNMTWNYGDWEIDKKPMDKLLSQNAYLTPYQLDTEATKEKEDLTEALTKGNAVAAGLANNGLTGVVTNELKTIGQTNVSLSQEIEEDQQFVPFISNPAVLETMDESFRRLYSKYLQKNNPLNYDIEPDLIRDPLTFTLVIEYDKLTKYIEDNNDNETADLYNAIIKIKKELSVEDKEYEDMCAKLASFKKEFNDKMRKNHKKLKELRKNLNDPSFNSKIAHQYIDNIVQIKVEFMNIYVKSAVSLMNIYNLQEQYFNALKGLLMRLKELFKNNYMVLIPYFEKPNLVLKCIEYDINIVNFLLVKDDRNKNSVSYFNNLARYKNFYNNIILANKDKLTNPQINYDEELQKYLYGDPSIILTEINQYQLYIYRILINYSYIQLDIWFLYLNTINIFTEFIKDVYSSFDLDAANKLISDYEQKYKNSDFLEKYKVNGLRATTTNIKNQQQLKWYLVNEEGKPCIPNESSPMLQEKMYIDMVKSQMLCYDSIILFMYLAEITCLRREKIIIAEENVQQINLEYSTYYRDYLKSINYLIQDYNSGPKSSEIYLPESINWDISKFIGIKQQDGSIDLGNVQKTMETNERSNALYLGKIDALQEKQKNLSKMCNEYIVSLLSPTISEDGFIKFCNNIYDETTLKQTYTPSSTYWLQSEISNYDFENTNNFNYLMMDVASAAYYDGIIDTRTPEGYINWTIINNEGSGDCLFAAVRDALNGQLVVKDATTTNKYSEKIDGINQFTISSLRKLVADNFSDEDYEFLCLAAGGTINNGQCSLNRQEMIDLQQNNLELYNMLVENNKVRTIDEVKKYMEKPREYWGDEIAIKYLQQVLKIKFIIFEMFEENKIRVGKFVYYNDKKYVVISENGQTINLENLDDTPGPQNIDKNDVELARNNILKNLRIVCDKDYPFNEYIMLVAVNVAEKGEPLKLHYELIKNTTIEDFVFTKDEIPVYVQYFMYQNCYKYLSDEARLNVGFQEFRVNFDNFSRTTAEYKAMQIQGKIISLNKKIKKYGTELQKISGQQMDQEDKNKKMYKLQMKIKQLKEDKDELMYRSGQQGGAPIDDYNQNVVLQQNPYLMPYAYAPNPYYAYGNQLLQNYENRPYIMTGSLAKEKDQKSKLSYYVTINLDLYPGTTANPLQRSAVLCHSRFEEIRHAFADMFGYIYRPTVRGSSYAYEKQYKEEHKDKDEKKGGKTRKNKTKYNKTLKKLK